MIGLSGAPLAHKIQAVVRSTIRPVREISPHIRLFFLESTGPKLVFLPVEDRKGAALLRCYAMARALRAHGWRTLCLSPKLNLAQRRRLLMRAAPDLIVMQGARHPLNRPAAYPEWPIVYDMDDADFHLPHLAGPVARAMPEVAGVLAGSLYIAKWCLGAGVCSADVVWTGTPMSARPRPDHGQRLPVVAWAQTRPQTYSIEAAFVRDVMQRVARAHPGVVLRLFDRRPEDDPAFADSFAIDGLTVEWVPQAKYSDYFRYFDDVSVGLAPLSVETPFSRGKSFGKVLAYLDRGVPIVASDAGEHPTFFSPESGIVSNVPEAWATGILHLLHSASERNRMAKAALMAFEASLTSEVAAERTDAVLRRVLAEVSGRGDTGSQRV